MKCDGRSSRPPVFVASLLTLSRLFRRFLTWLGRRTLLLRGRRARRCRRRSRLLRRRLHVLLRLRRRLHLPWLRRRLHLMLRLRRRRWRKATLLRRRLRGREWRRLRRDWPHDHWLLLRRAVRRSLGPAQLRLRWRWRG